MEQPVYRPDGPLPAFALRWVWTGWPSTDPFPAVDESMLLPLFPIWENDGIRVLERHLASDRWSFTVSTRPSVVPTTIVSRLKGRLDHAMRRAGTPIRFSRKVALRSIGDNIESEVRNYIANQVNAAGFLDDHFAHSISPYARAWPERNTSDPIAVDSGRYWVQLHIVLVTEHRYRYRSVESIAAVDAAAQAVASEHGYLLGSLAVLPDHMHMHLRGPCDESPEQIAHTFQNETAQRLRIPTFWQPTYYVGTVGAFNMRAIREKD